MDKKSNKTLQLQFYDSRLSVLVRGLALVRPGLNVIVEFFGVRLPKYVRVLKFMVFRRNGGRGNKSSKDCTWSAVPDALLGVIS